MNNNHDCLTELVKDKIAYKVIHGQVLFTLDGVEIKNDTGKTIYVCIFDEEEPEAA